VLSGQRALQTVLTIVDGFDSKSFRLKVFGEHAAHFNIVINHKDALHKVVLLVGLD
jgi:hypothetical protein